MSKKIDPISHLNKNQRQNIVDLRKIIPKKDIKIESLKNSRQQKEEEKKDEIKEIKISPKLSDKKKLQPIWWTIEEKYYFNSWISIIFFIFSFIFIISAFIQKNWIFILIIIFVNILFVLYFLKPQKAIYRLTDKGFYIEESFYPYSEISYFWILETEYKNYIIFQTNKIFNRHIFLPFKKEKTEKIRDFLKNFLIENEIKPSLIDLISNIL